MPFRRYTAEEDALIMRQQFNDDIIAVRVGRTKQALQNRRQYLLRKRDDNRKPKAEKKAITACHRFARPAWFTENLSALTKGAF